MFWAPTLSGRKAFCSAAGDECRSVRWMQSKGGAHKKERWFEGTGCPTVAAANRRRRRVAHVRRGVHPRPATPTGGALGRRGGGSAPPATPPARRKRFRRRRRSQSRGRPGGRAHGAPQSRASYSIVMAASGATVPDAILDQRRKAGSPESSIPAHLPVFLLLFLSSSALLQK